MRIFSKINYQSKIDYSHLRLTLDEKEDYLVIRDIFKYFKNDIYFNFNDIKLNLKKFKKTFKKNAMHKRNEGSKISKGQKLWQKAKKIIPGGNMFFSKNPSKMINRRDGYLIVIIGWLAMVFSGTLPYIFTETISNTPDLIFETMSGIQQLDQV